MAVKWVRKTSGGGGSGGSGGVAATGQLVRINVNVETTSVPTSDSSASGSNFKV